MIVIAFSGEPDDDVGAESESRHSCGQRQAAFAVGCRGIPMPAHALQDRIAAGLQRRMKMRCQPMGSVAHEIHQTLVDFGSLHGRESESGTFHLGYQALHQTPQTRPIAEVLPVGSDMHSGENDLLVIGGQNAGLLNDFVHRTRSARPPGNRRRAECAVLVTAVLDFQPGPGPSRKGAQDRIYRRAIQSKGVQDVTRVRACHDGHDSGERRQHPVVNCGGTSHDHGLQLRSLTAQASHEAAHFRLTRMGHRTRVDDGDVRHIRMGDGRCAGSLQRLSHRFRIVLVGLAAEGMEIDAHRYGDSRTIAPA